MNALRTVSSTALAAIAGALAATACQDVGPLDPVATAAPMPRLSRVSATGAHPSIPVPYVGTLTTTSSVPAAPPPGCQLFLNTTLEGEASILGHYTGVGTTCGFNGQMGVTDPPFRPEGGPPYFVSDFTVQQTHTAANGDQMEVSGDGHPLKLLPRPHAGALPRGVGWAAPGRA